MKEVIRKYAQHKEKTVCTVRYDVVRQNGMCMMTAVTDDSHDTDGEDDLSSGNEVGDSTIIVSMYVAASSGATDRAGLTFSLWFRSSLSRYDAIYYNRPSVVWSVRTISRLHWSGIACTLLHLTIYAKEQVTKGACIPD